MGISDWSSDVCSSDLGSGSEFVVEATEAVILIARQAVGKVAVVQVVLRLVISLEGLLLGLRAVAQVVDAGSASVGPRATEVGDRHLGGGAGVVGVAGPGGGAEDDGAVPRSRLLDRLRLVEIGRASCRERVCQDV